MTFTKKTWKEDGTTPITAAELNRIETQYDEAKAWAGQVVRQGDWVKTDRVYGSGDSNIVYMGSDTGAPCRFDTAGTSWRLGLSGTNYLRQDSDGSFVMVINSLSRHVFRPDGTKSGGSIVIDGANLGMSPIDSPQTLIEYVLFNVELTAAGTRIDLDPKYRKAVENFAVFPNNGIVIEKGNDYFVIKGEGLADIRLVGERAEYGGSFWVEIESEQI